MQRKHENHLELVWSLARTDFKLRYHGSILGYIWAILKPLLMFLILNFVFSSIFNPKNTGTEHFSLQLITSIMLFTFFSEGTSAGLSSLVNKAALVTKIYVPRWTIIVASTLNSFLIFLMNLFVIAAFFVWDGFWPGFFPILVFFFYIIMTYIIVVGFSFMVAPLYVRFRDVSQIWEVVSSALFYASPIIYPLASLPAKYHQILLMNPIGFIVHFVKMALTENHYAPLWENAIFVTLVIVFFFISLFVYSKTEKKVAENI